MIAFLLLSAAVLFLWWGRRSEADFENGMTPYDRFWHRQDENERELAKISERRALMLWLRKMLLRDDD